MGAKPLSKPMLCYCQLDPSEQTSVGFYSKYQIFVHEDAPEEISQFCPGEDELILRKSEK